jgi:hypothetical protein
MIKKFAMLISILSVSFFFSQVNFTIIFAQAGQTSQSPQSALQSAQPGQPTPPGSGGQGTENGPSVSSDHTGYNLTGQTGRNFTSQTTH